MRMAKKESEAVKIVQNELDDFSTGKYREMLLEMYADPKIQKVDAALTAMGLTTVESKLEALDPLFKKYRR